MKNKIEVVKMSTAAVVSFSMTIGSSLLMSLLEKNEHLSEGMTLSLVMISAFIYLGLYLGSLSGIVTFFDKFIKRV